MKQHGTLRSEPPHTPARAVDAPVRMLESQRTSAPADVLKAKSEQRSCTDAGAESKRCIGRFYRHPSNSGPRDEPDRTEFAGIGQGGADAASEDSRVQREPRRVESLFDEASFQEEGCRRQAANDTPRHPEARSTLFDFQLRVDRNI